MRLFAVIVALVSMCVPALADRPVRSRLGPWRPSLTAEADMTQLKAGATITVSYNATNATSVQAFVNEWGQWIGWSDGVVMPATSGTFTVTPTVPGNYDIVVAAWRRARDLNGDGKADGHRRSVVVRITITVQ